MVTCVSMGRWSSPDQDLALRVLYRRSLWTHVESQVGDLRAARAVAALTLVAMAAGLGLLATAAIRSLRPSRANARLSPAMTTPEKTAGRDRAGRRRGQPAWANPRPCCHGAACRLYGTR